MNEIDNKTERKNREKEFKQKIILQAAKQLFEVKGYNNTTLADIATEAGFAKGTLYLYFKNKSEIILYLILELKEDFSIELDNILNSKTDSRAKFKMIQNSFSDLVLYKIEKIGVYDFLKDITFKELEQSTIGEKFCEYESGVISLFKKIVIQGKKEGIIDPNLDPQSTAILLDTLMEGVIHKFATYDKIPLYENLTKKEFLNKIFSLLARIFK
ncbi:MAG: TetR/AcrR family transcriptional regulator [Candidatus Delongbacteria bacterium]|nr:TetR/AcrR family transcriptional regulator [Candidatus Delongbacteria bacterium]MBN2834770.1 TetR/AcrR family transcriptional regulator [Candidatus Delongbacteria bacterium]